MSFSVALAIHNLARVEEVRHPAFFHLRIVLRRVVLRGREVSVEKHCASRALALFLVVLSRGDCGTQAAVAPPWLVRVLSALEPTQRSSAGALVAGFGRALGSVLRVL